MTEPLDREVSVPYTCKMCGRDGFSAASTACGEVWFNKLYPLIVCNPCADWRAGMTRLRDAVKNAVVDLLRARQYAAIAKESEKQKASLADMEGVARGRFVTLTKQIAQLHCNYRRIVTVWEPDFAEQLMRRPEKYHEAINFYIQGIDGMRNNQPA
jgi:hypothetical protein